MGTAVAACVIAYSSTKARRPGSLNRRNLTRTAMSCHWRLRMARRPRRWIAKSAAAKRPARSAPLRPVSSAPRRLHNLPTQLTSFVGREREIAEIKRLLGTTRLVTLTGSGGCGKTRLALQVAADLLE